ncbi:MAG: hypothetical protein ACRYFZ_13620 [Janthinobacterium lividum]
MKLLLLLLAIYFPLALSLHAQTKEETFAEIAKMVAKAKGQTHLNFVGWKEKVTKQVFTEASVSSAEVYDRTEWTTEYTDIPW